MAITKGINISCDDLQASGGIRTILIREWQTDDSISYSNNATTHGISNIQQSDGAGGEEDALWYIYEFKNELPSLTVTGSKENGSTVYDCSLSFMMPEMDKKKSAVLQELMGKCLMAVAIGNNGKAYVLGVSEKYQNESSNGAARNQTFASMSALEGASGAAYNDDSGWTATLSCRQWELLRVYTGEIVLYVAQDGSTSSDDTAITKEAS